MIFFGHFYDRFDNVWEASTAAPALLQGMVDLGRNNKLPAIFVEEPDDGVLDLFLGNNIAVADKHQNAKPMRCKEMMFRE
ncbi:hypothetical protein ATN84_08620 [Paramesorhizobium deserti]|uniref:Uncharacterized protein n=1 Tax=Paramesorhizobium deserti TaxID=1494590 RepID=A0A135HW55_9HYPH|nr:hypothetical protein ATN84_08620 [Paramesorhizobium deserti]